jgi:histone acetyltransferase (RNA polymerase elongator complex component)
MNATLTKTGMHIVVCVTTNKPCDEQLIPDVKNTKCVYSPNNWSESSTQSNTLVASLTMHALARKQCPNAKELTAFIA